MSVIETLKENYGYNNPILLNQLNIDGVTSQSLRQIMNRLTKSGQLERFAPGIYFIPTNTRLGNSSLSIRKVIEKKYITDGSNVYGFYAGLSFENQLGLTTQMPNVDEIVTNYVNSRVRNIKLNGQSVRLRKCPVKIFSENAKYLQFIDYINRCELNILTTENKIKLSQYIRTEGITQDCIFRYLFYFASSASKKLIESGMINEFT